MKKLFDDFLTDNNIALVNYEELPEALDFNTDQIKQGKLGVIAISFNETGKPTIMMSGLAIRDMNASIAAVESLYGYVKGII